MIQCIIFKFRKWHTCNYEWYRLYRSYENCRRPGVAILDMQMSKVPIISGYDWNNYLYFKGLLYNLRGDDHVALLHMAGLENSECIWKIQRKSEVAVSVSMTEIFTKPRSLTILVQFVWELWPLRFIKFYIKKVLHIYMT